jgi:hypothetical protein
MNEVDRRLQWAIMFKADPKVVSPSGRMFAWFPVYGWDYQRQCRRRLWLEKVIWLNALRLGYEYFTYAGSESEFYEKHGRYSWEP